MGMRTAWVRVGLYGLKTPEPVSDIETPDVTVDSLAHLAAILLDSG